MIKWCIVLLSAVATATASGKDYSIPIPTIDVYSPKGVRLAIPDESQIRNVAFFISLPRPIDNQDPGSVDSTGGYWTYWNPSLALNPADLLEYRISVNRGGYNWTRHGLHFVDKVLSLTDNSVVATAECDDSVQQQIAEFPNLDSDEERNLALSGGKQNALKTSYSMFKTMDSRPITRSSTTTTSGTFLIKPTGDVEGTGYKSASSFDSARPEGEQWQHAKGNLSPAELEALKALHGDDFFNVPGLSNNFGGATAHYTKKSSYSSSSQTLPSISTGSSYHQLGQATSSVVPVSPPVGGYGSYSKFEQHQTTNSAPLVTGQFLEDNSNSGSYITPTRTADSGYKTAQSKYHREETRKTSGGAFPAYPGYESEPFNSPASPDAGYKTVQSKYHREEVRKTSGTALPTIPITDNRRVDTYESPRPLAPVPASSLPNTGSAIRKTETYEYLSAPKTVAPLALSNTAPFYSGDIFRSSIRPSTPNSCSAAEYLGYKSASQIDVVALERNLQELQCLSVLAETSLKSEIRSLKEINSDLVARLQDLEKQFRQFRNECRCY